MRRTFPQKVKPVPSRTTEPDMTTVQPKSAFPETNRLTRRSAAMIGLALSMGTYSLPLPNQNDSARASEPVTEEPLASTGADAVGSVAVMQLASSAGVPTSEAPAIRHTVQDGQTLLQLAKFYGVDAALIAQVNGLKVDAVLQVGQVLTIPSDGRVATANSSVGSVDVLPRYYGLVGGTSVPTTIAPSALNNLSGSPDSALKAKQDEALTKLKQKRETLRLGLAGLQPETAKVTDVQASPSQVVEAVPVTSDPVIASVPEAKQSEAVFSAPVTPQETKPQVVLSPSVQPDPGSQPQTVASLPDTLTYQVNPGDTLGAIARSYGVSMGELAAINRLDNPNLIEVNQVLIIPRTGSIAKSDLGHSSLPAVSPDYSRKLAGVPSTSKLKEVTSETVVPTVYGQRNLGEGGDLNSQANYLDNLRGEISRLRDRYRGGVAQAQPETPNSTTVAASSSGQGAVNPEFNPDAYSTTLQSEVRQLRERLRTRHATILQTTGKPQPQTDSMTKPQAQVVAVAPLGSEKYDPVVAAKVGQTVSPNLPPLSSKDAYLPSGTGKFNGFIWPTKGVLTSGYGWRWGRMHRGIDIAADVGTPIYAAASGKVAYAGWNSGGYGYMVEIEHADGSMTRYAHNNRLLVQEGQQVEQGQQISEMGSTGYSTGPHLHFEIHPNGDGAVNPMAYLPNSRG